MRVAIIASPLKQFKTTMFVLLDALSFREEFT